MLGYDKTPAPTYASVRSVPTSLSSPTLPAATMGKSISRPVQPVHRHLFIVTGPAGCGKSSVAQYLAKSQDFPYIEGDEVRLFIDRFLFTDANWHLVSPSIQR